jgi:hypothetical protein
MSDAPNPWRETVRDIYDRMHFGPHNVFGGNEAAREVVALIEERHRDYFCRDPRTGRSFREPTP